MGLVEDFGHFPESKIWKRHRCDLCEEQFGDRGSLWPGAGKELGEILKFSEAFRKAAWSKHGVEVLTLEDFDLHVGDGEGELVSTQSALTRLAAQL